VPDRKLRYSLIDKGFKGFCLNEDFRKRPAYVRFCEGTASGGGILTEIFVLNEDQLGGKK
jgi:hypothetical protein